MCNRYRVSAKQYELAKRFDADLSKLGPEPERLPPPELLPKRIGWLVRQDNGSRILDTMQWGVPLKMKGARGQAMTKQITNVRNLTSPFWKSTIGNIGFRCFVPVTDFCEWEGEAGDKQERWFSLPSSPIFAFASVWRPTEQGNAHSFTCEPTPLVAPIHPKAMPVILQRLQKCPQWVERGHRRQCLTMGQPRRHHKRYTAAMTVWMIARRIGPRTARCRRSGAAGGFPKSGRSSTRLSCVRLPPVAGIGGTPVRLKVPMLCVVNVF